MDYSKPRPVSRGLRARCSSHASDTGVATVTTFLLCDMPAKIDDDVALALVSVYCARTSSMSLADGDAVLTQVHQLRCRKLAVGEPAPPKPLLMKTYLRHFQDAVFQKVQHTSRFLRQRMLRAL